MDFKNAAELLDICARESLPVSAVMRKRECSLTEREERSVNERMRRTLHIMREAVESAVKNPVKSMGGLIGGEAGCLWKHHEENICGNILSRAITYSMGVMEVNASMGLIVAAPTAGSAGVVPGVLLALGDEYQKKEEDLIDALFNAGAIGYLAMRNATVSGAVAGCQAEVGVASAMAASAVVELMGGTPVQCLDAGSCVLMNMLGLVCDPIGGLVECPCQGRNAAGVSLALTAAEISLSGIRQHIPFDEMVSTMYAVGRRIPVELRETALGGCAVAPAVNEKSNPPALLGRIV
ncbi:MAG: L-serine ammonia-lyase, iron-sulfur-dependent, subunit alpha [Clostridiales bacterium]|nr:L-serine ammonia-lyase, iron-sulfur-dependent, subunit alpha [Clostridiales bacterium]